MQSESSPNSTAVFYVFVTYYTTAYTVLTQMLPCFQYRFPVLQ